jgi:selenide,water dikinase
MRHWWQQHVNRKLMSDNTAIQLTQFAHGAGCGCKIAPQVLETILKTNDHAAFANLLVGNSSRDDAAVYDLGNGTALISTTDFFMPVVNDAFAFGQIASANAISDVYAMGGKPILAIAILGWPVEKLPAELAQQVLEGSRSICAAAGIPLAGGHSVDSTEPFFGLAVNGIVAIENLKKNNTAKAGDVLMLTKPLGVGILTTAQKRGVLTAEDEGLMLQQLTALNTIGEALGKLQGVHAMTDITGFGLLGHVLEMAEGSGLGAIIHYDQVPMIESAKGYLAQRIVPDATYRNWNSYSAKVAFGTGVNVMEAFSMLPDPQTNGGILVAVDPSAVAEVVEVFHQFGIASISPIGYVTEAGDKPISVQLKG